MSIMLRDWVSVADNCWKYNSSSYCQLETEHNLHEIVGFTDKQVAAVAKRSLLLVWVIVCLLVCLHVSLIVCLLWSVYRLLLVTTEICGNGLQDSHSHQFISIPSHDVSHLIPIPVPLPKFIPIFSHPTPIQLIIERHLSVNNQTMISVQSANTQLS